MADDDLTVTRWTRYGKDRLYVRDRTGRGLGYLDKATGAVHVEDETDRAAVTRAVGVPEQRRTDAHPYAVTVERWATDLATNRPGAGAREIAQQHRRAAPVRSLVARALGVHTDERAWRVGAEGEETVARELAKLDGQWTVVHDVPVGDRGANIDHVIVGPGGVFTVNSKWHAGKSIWVSGDTVLVDGHRQPYVRNARHEAQRASRLLSAAYGDQVPVTGLVAVLAQSWKIKGQPADGRVLVLRPSLGRRMLQQLPSRYAVHEVDRLALWVRRSTTWQP